MNTNKFIMRLLCVISLMPSCDMLAKPKLSDFKYNIYSQFGEDGILAKIFEKIGTTSKIAIEFGAADGFSCSNTANLWSKDSSWKGILIEYNESLYHLAAKNTAAYNCAVMHKKVGVTRADSLEAILRQENLFLDSVDVLSIDIDGNDYYVFQSLERLRPRVVIIEYNVSIPAHLDVYPDVDNYIGCSVAALQRVAAEKGYSLVAITDTNCFFVVNEEMPQLAEFDTERDHIKIDKYLSYIISDYSGHYKVIGDNGFTDAWGWNKHPSQYSCNGACKNIPTKIVRDK